MTGLFTLGIVTSGLWAETRIPAEKTETKKTGSVRVDADIKKLEEILL
jgi:hypothetical protein